MKAGLVWTAGFILVASALIATNAATGKRKESCSVAYAVFASCGAAASRLLVTVFGLMHECLSGVYGRMETCAKSHREAREPVACVVYRLSVCYLDKDKWRGISGHGLSLQQHIQHSNSRIYANYLSQQRIIVYKT